MRWHVLFRTYLNLLVLRSTYTGWSPEDHLCASTSITSNNIKLILFLAYVVCENQDKPLHLPCDSYVPKSSGDTRDTYSNTDSINNVACHDFDLVTTAGQECCLSWFWSCDNGWCTMFVVTILIPWQRLVTPAKSKDKFVEVARVKAASKVSLEVAWFTGTIEEAQWGTASARKTFCL